MTAQHAPSGKTKVGRINPDHPEDIIFLTKKDTTAHNDPGFTQLMEGKPEWVTTMNCVLMEYLERAGIPVAYRRRYSPTEFVAKNVNMILLEVIARRLLTGSFLKRNPHVKDLTRVARLIIEFHLKTTGGKLEVPAWDELPGAITLLEGLTKDQDDPFIVNPFDNVWNIRHPKEPMTAKGENKKGEKYDLGMLDASMIGMNPNLMRNIEELQRKIFLLLEALFARYNLRLVDLKCEFGVDPRTGEIVLADVTTLDELRLHRLVDGVWKEISKQLFRDGVPIHKVAKNYEWFAGLLANIVYTKQAVVMWRASPGDKIQLPKEKYPFVDVRGVTCSGHKQTETSLAILNELHLQYPGGFVVVPYVGRSNGLGPVIQGSTTNPVVSVCGSLKDFPNDAWSSIRMPSDIPMVLAHDLDLGVAAAYNMLGQNNPFVRGDLQFEIEKRMPEPDFNPAGMITPAFA